MNDQAADPSAVLFFVRRHHDLGTGKAPARGSRSAGALPLPPANCPVKFLPQQIKFKLWTRFTGISPRAIQASFTVILPII
jgi:hypothetical protein